MRTQTSSLLFSSLLLIAASASAQVKPPVPPNPLPPAPTVFGTWDAAFQHDGSTVQPVVPGTCASVAWPNKFLASHMAVIPKPGPHQGHVIVWDQGSSNPPTTCQRWAILDPETKTFWNHFLSLPRGNVKEDFDQRCVMLEQVSSGAGTIEFRMPPNSRYAPKGWYMLFLVSNQGVPSVASWVQLQ